MCTFCATKQTHQLKLVFQTKKSVNSRFFSFSSIACSVSHYVSLVDWKQRWIKRKGNHKNYNYLNQFIDFLQYKVVKIQLDVYRGGCKITNINIEHCMHMVFPFEIALQSAKCDFTCWRTHIWYINICIRIIFWAIIKNRSRSCFLCI